TVLDGAGVGVVLVLVADGQQVCLQSRQLGAEGRRIGIVYDGRRLPPQSEAAMAQPGDVQVFSPSGGRGTSPYIRSGALTPIRPSAMRRVFRAARDSSSRARVSAGSGTTTRWAATSLPA